MYLGIAFHLIVLQCRFMIQRNVGRKTLLVYWIMRMYAIDSIAIHYDDDDQTD
jgi:hypothetical protein